MKATTLVMFLILALAIGAVVSQFVVKGQIGSVATGQSYQATTTPYDGVWTDQQLDKGWGTLGSVVITSSGNLQFRLLNATTTEAAVRPAGRQATSTIILADFPANTSAGTYVFDAEYNDGLYLDVVSGNAGTSTITFK